MLRKENIITSISIIILFIFYLERHLNINIYLPFVTKKEYFPFYIGMSYAFQSLLVVSLFIKSRLIGLILLILNSILYIPITYGADIFAYNLLIFTFLIDLRKKKTFSTLVGYFILMPLLIIIYLNTGISKLTDPLWNSGEGMHFYMPNYYQILKDTFNKEVAKSIDTVFSYSLISLQFSIILILFKKTRRFISCLFIMKHLGIAILMHPYFGAICALIHLHIFSYKGSLIKDLKVNLFSKSKSLK